MGSHRYEDWIDRYLRDELSLEQEAELEAALLESPELQQELEAAMGIRQGLALEQEAAQAAAESTPSDITLSGRDRWQPLALAASVILAVFSTTMYWRISHQAAGLQAEIESLRQPRGTVLTVPVDIVRSAGSREPDVIVKKPAGRAVILLDIEASPAALSEESVRLTLRDQAEVPLLSWVASPDANGRILSAIDAASLPAGLLWLEMDDGEQVIDRRLIELR